MEKKPFVTKAQLEAITKTYPTPFHLYDEKGIRENAKRLKEAFSWNKGYIGVFCSKGNSESVYSENPAGVWLRHGLFLCNRADDV